MGIRLNYEISGRLQSMLHAIENPDFSDLMDQIRIAMDEDHVRGVIAGKDKDGNPLVPVKYRTGRPGKLKRKSTIRNWRTQGSLTSPNDSLTTSEYRKLTGPPLAPRGLDSRVVRNFETAAGFTGKEWFVESFLTNVLNRKGEPFMHYHFDGSGRLPVRDLRGIRPEGRERIKKLLALEIRRQFFNRS